MQSATDLKIANIQNARVKCGKLCVCFDTYARKATLDLAVEFEYFNKLVFFCLKYSVTLFSSIPDILSRNH